LEREYRNGKIKYWWQHRRGVSGSVKENADTPFDEFVETGNELLAIRDSLESGMELDDADLIPSLSSSWRALLSDQLVRLKAL
jgi:hypothetical protein